MSFSIRHDVFISRGVILQLEHQDRMSTFKKKNKKNIVINSKELWDF